MAGDSAEIFPRPRDLKPLAGSGAEASQAAEIERDESLGPEAFTLEILDGQIRLRHGDDSALRYATAVLDQLRSQFGSGLPALRIEDAPDYPVRGYMLDISRDRVPTRACLETLVAQLALFRINHLELYTEHTFAYRDHEVVWKHASPMTAEDVAWLDALCREHGIELCANQNTFGHMARWIRHEEYRARAETPDGYRTSQGIQLSASVLAPTEENAALAVDLCRELLSHHTSQRINIGCDETFELGRGQSAEAVAERGRAVVYVEHLKRLIEGLHAAGATVLFWGDILRGHPELVRELPPENTIALAWHYEAPGAAVDFPPAIRKILDEIGIEMTPEMMLGFKAHVAAFENAGLPYWVCPGTSSWNTLIGRLGNARGNLLDAAETGLAHGASGYLITDWGDNGHLQPPSVSLPPLAYGAAVAWGTAANRDVDPARFLDAFVFGDEAHVLGETLNELGSLYARTGKIGMNGSPLFTELVGGGLLGSQGEADPAGVASVIASLDAAIERLSQARPTCSDGDLVVRELAQAARLARHGAYRIARAAGLDCPDDATLRQDLIEAIAEQRACWLLRSRPGGLDDSVAGLEKTLAGYAD